MPTLLRVECAACRAVLQVRPELAGHEGRCPKCGARVTIPSTQGAGSDLEFASPSDTVISQSPPPIPPPVLPPVAVPPATIPPIAGPPVASNPNMPLAQATAPDMMVEIARRKKSAVLVVFETPIGDGYELSRQPNAKVRCYRTADMTDAELMQVLEEVGRMSQGQQNPKGGIVLTPGGEPPFELKGDRLGMTLEEFKAKHARTVGGMRLPYTSETTAGQANPTLWSEAWHAAAGIVNGRVELPSEGHSPTVAGVKSELFLYHFVDGRLYRMTILFDTEAFHLVREALGQKFGPPTSEVKDPLEVAWENSVSTVRLVRGTMRPKKWSSLFLVHHELQQLAESRVPQRDADV